MAWLQTCSVYEILCNKDGQPREDEFVSNTASSRLQDRRGVAMRLETHTCDVCGTPKGVGNRWLVGWKVNGGFALADWGFAPSRGQSGETEQVYHFCSEAHALSEQAKHLRQDRMVESTKIGGPVAVRPEERKMAS